MSIAAAAALALSACAPPGAAEPAETAAADPAATGTLKVGFISPTTGNFAVAGQEMVDGWNLYWETQGDEVNGVKIETPGSQSGTSLADLSAAIEAELAKP